MLGVGTFGFDLVRKYVAVFGNLFSEIAVPRIGTDGKLNELVKVSITYGPKEKVLARLIADPNIDRQAAVVLPSMSYELKSLKYAAERHLESTQKTVKTDPGVRYKYVFMPVPYDLNFSLYVYCKAAEDGSRIIEQILPFFTPEFTVTMNLITDMSLSPKDIPITLQEITLSDTYDGEFTERRVLTWQLDFSMKAYLWGPIRTFPVIKFVNVNFFDSTLYDNIANSVGVIDPVDRVTVRPGLTANGEPTSHANQSVPYGQIDASDDFGYVIQIYGNLDAGENSGGDETANTTFAGYANSA